MDSYFATVEQQANPLLRGKPIVVSGKEGSRSVIVASSKEAKKRGVKTAMLHHEARKLCPELIFVQPDGGKYSFLTNSLIEIFSQYTDKIEIFSIDEAFLELTGFVNSWNKAVEIAEQIKCSIKNRLGQWTTCSIGISPNKLLSKLGSDLKKPDGVVVINEQNLYSIINFVKLTDFCGIGRRVENRLFNMGIDTVVKLRKYPVGYLIKEFGPFYGQKLHNMSLGLDDEPVSSYLDEEDEKSIGRSYTLPYNTYSKEEILGVLSTLCEKVGFELRRKKITSKTIVIYLRNSDFSHLGFRKTLPNYVDDGDKIFQLGKNLLSKYNLRKAVRLVGVYTTNFVKHFKQLPLWEKERKKINLLPALDDINSKFGEMTIKPAFLLAKHRLRKRVGGFKLRN